MKEENKEERHKRFDEKFGDFFQALTKVWAKLSEYDSTINVSIPVKKEANIKSFIDTEVDLATAEAYQRAVEDMKREINNLGYTEFVASENPLIFHPKAIELERIESAFIKVSLKYTKLQALKGEEIK